MNEETKKLLSSLTPRELINLYLQSYSDIEEAWNYLPSGLGEEIEEKLQHALDVVNYPRFKNNGQPPPSTLN